MRRECAPETRAEEVSRVLMFEVMVGLLLLLLGWRCFRQGSAVRAVLGLLLILSGAALLALAVSS